MKFKLKNHRPARRPSDFILFPGVNDRAERERLMDEAWREICDAMAASGIDPAIIYATRKTGRIVTELNAHLLTPEEIAEWEAAIAEYEALVARGCA